MFLEVVEQRLNVGLLLAMQHQDLVLLHLAHFLLVLLKRPELLLLELKLLLVQLLQLFLALVVGDLHVLHLLGVVVLLLSLFKLQVAVALVRLTKFVGHFFLHLSTALLEAVLARAQIRLDLVGLVFHLLFELLLVSAPLLHLRLAHENDIRHLELGFDLVFRCDGGHRLDNRAFYISFFNRSLALHLGLCSLDCDLFFNRRVNLLHVVDKQDTVVANAEDKSAVKRCFEMRDLSLMRI